MKQSSMSQARTKVATWSGSRALLIGVMVYGLAACMYVLLGQPNADESWYIYASQQVFRGALPYRDFAYTQMPLLPYVYGVPQFIFGSSLIIGRVTSLLLNVVTFALCLGLARRYGGERAMVICALLLGTWWYGVYFHTITKTYALVSFFFAATLALLGSRLRHEIRLPLAAVCVLLASLTRLSAVFFALPIFFYCFMRKPKLMLVCALPLLAVAAATPLLIELPNFDVLRWNLLGHHVDQWGTVSWLGKVGQIVGLRLPSMLLFWGPYLLLAWYACHHRDRRTLLRTWSRQHVPEMVVGSGVLLFVAAHLATGGWHIDYLIPAAVVLAPFLAALLAHAHQRMPARAHRIMTRALITTGVYGVLTGVYFIDLRGAQLPLAKIDAVAAVVAQHAAPNEPILVLEGLWVAIEAERAPLPGMSMAQFSLADVDRTMAERFHLINGDMVVERIKSRMAPVAVLTALDWSLLEQTGYADAVRTALQKDYRVVFAHERWGQRGEPVQVWVRKP